MRILTTTQRTPDWYAARVGMLTASRAADMFATIKSGEAAARRDLRLQLVCEKLTGQSQDDSYVSPAMQRGIDQEAAAFAAYEAHTGQMAQSCGFLAHDTLDAGCSPDGVLDGGAGLIELKCPKSATHYQYLKAKTVPRDYLLQITHQLWITGAAWCDFTSFDDRFPEPLRLIVIRVQACEVDLTAYELAARLFLGEVAKELEAVRALSLTGAAV